ncbi:MAG TPA: hypothetical protein VE575_16875 [Acidimicrobiales bacterium]|nr:hypothetical protein [Acidimicrobiales bacterium]
MADLRNQATFRRRWLAEHPELTHRVDHVERELLRLDDPERAELLDRLDTIGVRDDLEVTQVREQNGIAKLRQRLDSLQGTRNIEPPGLSL